MDPYLEAPDIWPDFHDALAGEIRGVLNQTLPAPYYARLEMRPEVGIVEEGRILRRIVPDVAVVRHPRFPAATSGVAVLDAPRVAISEHFEVVVHSEKIRHAFIELRDPSRGHQLITLIEIVSPTNKQQGPDRLAYEQKQREVLESSANLIELDFLRRGTRLLPYPELEETLQQRDPPPDYVVLVNRASKREQGAYAYHIYPAMIAVMLPCIPIPLREGQPEVPLDLQFVFNRAYDSGPYWRGAVDYSRPPRPPLAAPWDTWADERVRAAGYLGVLEK